MGGEPFFAAGLVCTAIAAVVAGLPWLAVAVALAAVPYVVIAVVRAIDAVRARHPRHLRPVP
jgi:hypothetical protein